MNTLKYFFISAIAALSLVACDNDGDFLTVNAGDGTTLNGNSAEIVLDYDHADNLALTLYWSENGQLTLSNPLVAAPDNAIINSIQFSDAEDFTKVVTIQANAGQFDMQFTHKELNNVLGRLGFEGGVKAPLYIRICSALGVNIPATYSNVMKITVTPYVIDMSVGVVLSSGMEDTGLTLASPNSDGIYTGFVGAAGWFNYYLQEGDGTVWGNDGVVGTPFMMSKADTKWNFWYPGITGCYWTVVDTNKMEWSALLISELTISGDVNGEMVYDRKANNWIYTFNASASGTINVKIEGVGKQYNISTGTDDAAAVDTPIGFSGNADNLQFGTSASTIAVAVPSAGELSIVLDLSNPKEFKVVCESGGVGPVEVSQYLYMSGVDDNISGEWTFDNYLRLYDEDAMAYGGVCNVNSKWGYRFYTEAYNWSSAYTMVDGGTALSGNLIKADDSMNQNIEAPTPGLYLFDVSMSKLTYNLYAVNSVSYSGLNDDWTGFTPIAATGTPGVYSCEITINKVSEWGFKIYINDGWTHWFSGSDGVLRLYNNSGITDDATLGIGTYTLTVDLCKGTYSITK